MRDSSSESFKEMKILPLCSQYIFSLMLYVVNNRHLFTKILSFTILILDRITTYTPPVTSLTKVQKGAYYSGTKIYNHLPTSIKELSNEQKPFRSALKRFFYINSFYSMEEYFNYTM
jgi:hypothetical protein